MANRADQAGLVVQDIARSSVKKLVPRARSMRKQKGPAHALRRRARRSKAKGRRV